MHEILKFLIEVEMILSHLLRALTKYRYVVEEER